MIDWPKEPERWCPDQTREKQNKQCSYPAILAFCCWTEIIFQKHRHAIDKNSPSPLSCIDRLWTCAMLPEQILEQISPKNPQIFCQNPKSSQESGSSTIVQGEIIFTEGSFFPLNLLFFVFWYRQRTKSGQVLISWLCCLWYSTAVVVADGVCADGDGHGVCADGWVWCIGTLVTKSVELWASVGSPHFLHRRWAAYKLPLSHHRHPSSHLGPFERGPKSRGFCNRPPRLPSFLLPLMPAPTPLQSDNQLWPFSPRIPSDYRLFFQPQRKNAPLSVARLDQAGTAASTQNCCCSGASFQSFALEQLF